MRKCLFSVVCTVIYFITFAQVKPESGDPPNNLNIPVFFKSRLSDVQHETDMVKTGKVQTVALSPGELPVYAVYYGEKEDFHSQANYNSAVGARNPDFYAQKDSSSKPVVFFIGPVHGQEVEGIAGLVNLIHIAETGTDYRGKEWPGIKKGLEQCRTIIVPCANPDGRKRCPYDSFIGIPTRIMTKYGQGTRKDGTLWDWPGAKSLHPMKGNVGILGAYFNDNGINPMHDDFFAPMAEETKAILQIARSEAPDVAVSLHSHENDPVILQPAFVPVFIKNNVHILALDLNERLKQKALAFYPDSWLWTPEPEDKEFPPVTPYNLVSALHHVSGTTAFTFECSHGSVSPDKTVPNVSYTDILDIQLTLYDLIFQFAIVQKQIK